MEYYNDLPGKTPPEYSSVQQTRPNTARESVGSNLIDLHSDMSPTRGDPDYVNGEVPNPRKSGRDPFDMSTYYINYDLFKRLQVLSRSFQTNIRFFFFLQSLFHSKYFVVVLCYFTLMLHLKVHTSERLVSC